ncbi:S-adenosyl-L-methionine-dependent methyltransferase [Lentinus tigrinus ALCF2SS1-7]|uniref:S-adenosyl-L-methionine-dependent methyltransferase n=1 Tax=Lentinus tigrinus ALCF2SS1-6 TaxID=1328759 RepID=A0A5C2RSM3_9APHY|nr:S-adenosyl-L-methionine-dependent methyltransferase [Lentinus tigrinus ALCF2SS1-6]RPD75369.1 S-adenosyl-L-methionine-dependent methyltransferase [Lentinus tigrinus ALCF2SS1-7]
MSSEQSDRQYLLEIGEAERAEARLSLQYSVLQRICGHQVVFPSISFGAGDRILDSGTGSGMWLLDVAGDNAIPEHVFLQGIDVDDRLFPLSDPRVASRPNVDFRVESVLQLPHAWTNTFTLINQRLLGVALKEPEWPRALSEIHRVISPGGWVQLGELSDWKAGPVTARFRTIFETLFKSKGLKVDCAERLPDMLRDAGFVDVHEEVKSLPLGAWAGQDGLDARNVWIGTARVFKGAVLKEGGLGLVSGEDEMDELIREMEKEWDSTHGAFIQYHVMWGQKPSA